MNTFFVIFIGLPALEIFLMIKIGGKIGALNTIGLIFLTAVIGIYYARIQGIHTVRSGIINLYQNKAPINELMSGATIAFAALSLIFPGYLTDFFGFILLIPFTRNILFKFFLRNKKIINSRHEKNNDTIEGEVMNKDKDEL